MNSFRITPTLIILILSLVGWGCSTHPAKLSPEDNEELKLEILEEITLNFDEYKKQHSLEAPFFNPNSANEIWRGVFAGLTNLPLALGEILQFKLASVKKHDQQEWTTMLVVVWENQNWKFLRSAYLRGGQELKVLERQSQVLHAGRVSEILAIAISHQDLVSNQESGLDIRIDGDRGSVQVFLPSGYIKAFLLKKQEL